MSQDRTGPIVHVRENSDTELEALFNIAMNPQLASETNKSVPLRMRNLPASFFRPPEPPKNNMQNQLGVPASKDSQDAPVFHGGVNSSVNIAHMRAHSSPASLQQTLSAAPPPPPTGHHVRQHSYDLLDEQPLPAGWDMAKTPQGQRYYLNHVLQITTWNDPRKTHNSGSIASPNSSNNNNNNSTSNLNTSPQTGSPAPSSQPASNSPPVNVDKVPLPPGWERAFTAECEAYFINHIDRTTSWFHPAIPAHLQRPGMKFQQQQQQQQQQQLQQQNQQQQQQQQQQQVSSGPLSPPQQDQTKHLKLQQIQMEKELLKKRVDEIARQEMALRAGGDITAISQSSEMTSVADPFFGQTTTSDHHRQESGDSGLGGMGTFSLPRTPEDFLGNMEDMDTGEGGPKLAGQADFGSMDLAGVNDVADHLNMDSEDLVPSLQEEISSDLLKDVDTVLGNKDNPLTWL